MRTSTRIAAAVAAIALLTAACGGLNDDDESRGTTGGDQGVDHPTGSDELVLRIEVGGGFVPIEYNLAATPSLSLYGDGRLITSGPQIEIYPGPALPNLLVTPLTEDAVQAILLAADAAGLMDGDATYDDPCVTDVPSTTFTVVADGTTSVVSASALGSDDGAGTCEGVDEEARAALVDFQSAIADLPSLVPTGSVGAEEPYVPTAIRVHALPYRGDPELPQEPIAWPLAEPLATFGEPIDVPEGARCGVIEGEDVATVLDAAAGANQMTPWTSDGDEHALIFRPLLPDETGC